MSNSDLRSDLRVTYNRHAQERDSSPMQDWKIRERAGFLAVLREQNRKTLLEIGAGTGRDGKYFQDQGLDVVCIDLSPAMIELCLQKGLTAHVMDMTDLKFPANSFDAVYAFSSLLHLPKTEVPHVLNQIHRVLRPDGLAYIGVYGGFDHEGIWEQDHYRPKRFFSFFSDEHLKQEVARVFEVLRFERVFFEADDPLHYQSLWLKKRDAGPNDGR